MSASTADVEARRQWMRVLSTASTQELADAWEAWEVKPDVESIRGPEAGLVMVRARIGAGGERFNLGEATATRATLHLSGEPLATATVGTSYVLGTDLDHAWLAAAFDGLLADAQLRSAVLSTVVNPLADDQCRREEDRQADARSTKVDFFTVAREHA